MGAPINPVWVSGHYRFENDDGFLESSTFIAAEDTTITQDADTPFRLRINWGESAGQNQGDVLDAQLQFRINAGAWTTVTTSTAVKFIGSVFMPDGTLSFLQRLTTPPTGVFLYVDSEFDDNNVTRSLAPVIQYYEDIFNIQIDSAQVANSDTVDFQIIDGSAVETFDTIDTVPSLTANVLSGLSIVKIISETENSNEVENTSIALNRLLAETLNAKETAGFGVITALVINRIIDELEQTSENNIPIRARNQIINEALNITETRINVLAALIIEIISEAVNSNETTNISLSLTRLIDEILNINEVIAQALSKVRVLSEVENMNESTLVTKIIVELINEILNSQETTIQTKSIINVLSEIINLPETSLESLAAVIVEIISETVNFNETRIEVLAALIVEIINEVINHPETVLNSSLLVRQIVEVVQDSESIDTALARIRIIFESQTIPENNYFVRSIIQVINETLDFVENILQTTIAPIVGALSAMISLLPTLAGKGNIKAAIKGQTNTKAAIDGKTKVKPKNG